MLASVFASLLVHSNGSVCAQRRRRTISMLIRFNDYSPFCRCNHSLSKVLAPTYSAFLTSPFRPAIRAPSSSRAHRPQTHVQPLRQRVTLLGCLFFSARPPTLHCIYYWCAAIRSIIIADDFCNLPPLQCIAQSWLSPASHYCARW